MNAKVRPFGLPLLKDRAVWCLVCSRLVRTGLTPMVEAYSCERCAPESWAWTAIRRLACVALVWLCFFGLFVQQPLVGPFLGFLLALTVAVLFGLVLWLAEHQAEGQERR